MSCPNVSWGFDPSKFEPRQEPFRELWRPTREDQMAALEILFASSIPTPLRQMLREMEVAVTTGRNLP